MSITSAILPDQRMNFTFIYGEVVGGNTIGINLEMPNICTTAYLTFSVSSWSLSILPETFQLPRKDSTYR